MSFKIRESFVLGKRPDQALCEDHIIVTKHFVCVVDGATSKSVLAFDGKTQGVVVGEIVREAMLKCPPEAEAGELIRLINRCIKGFYRKHDLESHMKLHPVDRLTASLAVYSDRKRQVWLVGDCQAMIGQRRITNKKEIDTLLAGLRSFVIQYHLARGMDESVLATGDVGRENIWPYLTEQSAFQNDHSAGRFSYGVVDGFEVDNRQVRSYDVREGERVVLATDGYPRLFASLRRSENYLSDMLAVDPYCYKVNLSTKGMQEGDYSYDDRAYVNMVIGD